MSNHIDIVLGPDPHGGPDTHFIEIEVGGRSVRIGRSLVRPDGNYAIRITQEEIENIEKRLL